MNDCHLNKHTAEILDAPLNNLTYVVFDLETTGTCPECGDKIIEIGAVKLISDFRIQPVKFHTMVNPGISIPDSSTDIHGITNDNVKNAPDVCVAIYDFIDFARGSVIVAHNAKKDLSFLKNEMKEYGIRNPFTFILDTLKLSRIVNPSARKHNLDYITDKYKINVTNSYKRHRALYDAEATAIYFKMLMRKIFKSPCFTLFELINVLKDR